MEVISLQLAQAINDIFQAAKNGDTAAIRVILESNPTIVNAENNEGLTLLGFAAHYGNKDVVQVLLEHGADVNAVSHSKVTYIPSNTALHAAIAGQRNMEVIYLLLANHAQTHLFDSNGHTSLHTAAFHDDNIELIRLLLEHGANVNAKIEGGDTAMSVAIKQGNTNVVEFLRQCGALQ
jgi:ankyrin repeat protein